MSEGGRTRIAVAILATRGGEWLETALERVRWADVRVVVDPAGRVDAAALAANVPRVVDPRELEAAAGADWVLLLTEDERIDTGGEARLAGAVAVATPKQAFRVGIESRALDLAVRTGGRPVRLAPRGAAIRVGAQFGLALVLPGARVDALDVAIVRDSGASLTEVVEGMAAEARALAALADRLGRTTRGRGMVSGALLAGAATLVGRARSPLGLGRWVLAVLAAYRVVVAHATLWERRRDRVLEIA